MDNILQKPGKFRHTKFIFKFSACMSCTNAHKQAFTFVSCQLFCSVSSWRMAFFVDTNLQQLEGLVPREWACNHGGSLQRVCTATDGSLFWFCKDLQRHYSVICCFGIFWTISDNAFKINILPTCDFFDTLVLQASSTVSITYQILESTAISSWNQPCRTGSGLWE